MQLRTTVLAIPAVLLVGCTTTPAKIDATLQASPDLLRVNPSDIAVLPVEDASTQRIDETVLQRMREELAKALVHRMYTPIAPAKVDEVLAAAGHRPPSVSVMEASWLASLEGRFGEDATLAVRITKWDDSSLMATSRVRFASDVTLISPGAPATPLWSGTYSGEVKAGGAGPSPRGRTARLGGVAEQFSIELIRLLPMRRP